MIQLKIHTEDQRDQSGDKAFSLWSLGCSV
jgi:hypothetical protein